MAAPIPVRKEQYTDLGRAVPGLSRALLPDTKIGEYPPQQIVTGELTGDLVQSLLGDTQLLGDELAGAAFPQLDGGFLGVPTGAGKSVEVTLPGGHGAGVEGLIAHT